MRRPLVVLLALAATLVACGRVGAPVRSRPRPEPAPAMQPAAAATPAAQNEQSEEEKKR
jgi:hypothetical protein